MGVRVLLVIAAASLLAGCGSRQTAGAAGLSGTVVVSPAIPVCRIGASCSRPARGLTLVFVRKGQNGKAKTDGRGRYRVALSPGDYTVQVAGARPGARLKPGAVTIRSGAYGNMDFRYDPGIR